jgi:putative tryptophan/tyrosine transport system substrate-binding protein
VKRRRFVSCLTALAVIGASGAAARDAGQRSARVGWLIWSDKGRYHEITSRAFVEGLRAAGYSEGENLIIERRVAQGDLRRQREQARELAQLGIDVFFAPTKTAADAAWYASRKIPTVIATVTDPVAVDYVKSLARPGLHITGVTSASAELSGKRLELLHEAVPAAARIGVLFDQTLYDSCREEIKQFDAAAKKLGVILIKVAISSPADVESAFRKLNEARAQALIMPLFTSEVDMVPEIARQAIKHRIPTMHEIDDFAETGGLMTYGPDFADVYRRAASYVARILRGERPAEMALEEPRQFKFIVNLQTARQLGLTLPESIMLRADEVIR